MVLVEFFSLSPIENMISAITSKPELIIFVGEAKKMEKQDPIFRRFLEKMHNTTTQLEYRNIKVHELQEIVRVVEQIAKDYPGCHFDLTGGDALAMTAVGMIYEKYRDSGIKLHQYNINTGRVYDCDLDGTILSSNIPQLSVEENIILHGGTIVDINKREYGTCPWDISEAFEKDVYSMWDICKKNCRLWNKQISMLSDMMNFNLNEQDSLILTLDFNAFRNYSESRGYSVNIKGVFPKLEKAGILSLGFKEDYFYLKFKNEQIKRCLTKAGTILEIYTLISARHVLDKENLPYYNDSMMGVVIDWDGIIHDELDDEVDTANEIDVILMHGTVPIFISCKNGAVGEEELYKLEAVARRFGSSYVKKVLVATTLGKATASRKYFTARAKEMKITLVDGVHEMSCLEFERKLKTLA